MNHPNLPKTLWVGAMTRNGMNCVPGSYEIFGTESDALQWVINGSTSSESIRLVWEWTPATGFLHPLEYVPPVPATFNRLDMPLLGAMKGAPVVVE
jgi:hypothetical protein